MWSLTYRPFGVGEGGGWGAPHEPPYPLCPRASLGPQNHCRGRHPPGGEQGRPTRRRAGLRPRQALGTLVSGRRGGRASAAGPLRLPGCPARRCPRRPPRPPGRAAARPPSYTCSAGTGPVRRAPRAGYPYLARSPGRMPRACKSGGGLQIGGAACKVGRRPAIREAACESGGGLQIGRRPANREATCKSGGPCKSGGGLPIGRRAANREAPANREAAEERRPGERPRPALVQVP